MGIIFILHVIILLIAFMGIVTIKHYSDADYYELFQQSAPRFYKTFALPIVLFVFYFIAYKEFFFHNYIDSFNSLICFIWIFVFSGIILSVFYLIYKNEILYPTDEFKSKNKYFTHFMILFLYAFSVILSCGFVFFTNSLLDFREQEEFVATVGNKDNRMGTNKGEGHHFEFYIVPTIGGINPIEVPSELYWSANKGDKVKLYLCKGLYGQRYFSKKMSLVKNNKQN